MCTVITERVKDTVSLKARIIMFCAAWALDAATLLRDGRDHYARALAVFGLAVLLAGVVVVSTDQSTAGIIVLCLMGALISRFAARVRAVAASSDALTKANAFRTVTYLSLMFLCLAVAIWLGWKLSSILETYSLGASTLVDARCDQPSNTTSGIIFPQTVDYKECPHKLWEHIRLNVLFVTQVYTLFTLTTTLRDSMRSVGDGAPAVVRGTTGVVHGGGHMALAFATVAECFLLSAAAVVQFDVIEDCYKVTTPVVALMCLAVGCLMYRVYYAPRTRTRTIWEKAVVYNIGKYATVDHNPDRYGARVRTHNLDGGTLYTSVPRVNFLRGKLKL